MENTETGSIFANHKIISSESKSWYVGKPGTTNHSFSITWAPGIMVMYGEKGSITLVYSAFSSYEESKQWLSSCTLDEFKGAISHNHPEELDFFYKAFRHWGKEPHYK